MILMENNKKDQHKLMIKCESTLVNLAFITLAFSLPISKALANVSAALLVILYLIPKDLSGKLANLKASYFSLMSLAFLVWTVFSGCYSEAPFQLIKQDLFKASFFILAPVISYYITDERKMLIINSFLIGGLCLVFFEIFEGSGLVLFLKTGVYGFAKTYSIYIYESYNLAIIIFSLLYFSKSQSGKERILFIALTLIVCAHATFMQGRMGLISLIFVLLYFFLGLWKENYIKIACIFMVAIIFMSSYFASPLIKNRFDRTMDEASEIIKSNNPSSVRFKYYKISFQMFLQNPVLGAGPGAFKNRLIQYEKSQPGSAPEDSNYHTHSDSLTILSQYGIIGFLLFSSIVYIAIKNSRNNPINHPAHIGLIGILLFLLNGLTDTFLYTHGLSLLVMMALCLPINKYILKN